MIWKRLTMILTTAIVVVMPGVGDASNQKIVLTVSQPVEVSGVVLPTGQYVFRLVNLASNRHVVQIFDVDEDQIYATLHTIPIYRMDPTDHAVVLLEEAAVGQPHGIHAWFYPGQNYGHEFLHS